MARTIKVTRPGLNGMESREVSLEEAQRILQETYDDRRGGLVANGKTREIIWDLAPDIEEIIVLDEIVCGG